MRRPVAGVNDGDSLQQWYRDIPVVTRTLVTSTLLLGACSSFGLFSPDSLIFYWPLIRNKFHIWRLFTPFVFAGGFSMSFVMHLVVLYENCKRYEVNPFNTGGGGTSADFLWMVCIGMIILNVIAYAFDIMLLSECLLYMIMYVWSRREPEAKLNFWGFKFDGIYLPWIYMGIRLLMGGSVSMPLLGVGVGHVYYFVAQVMPDSHGFNLFARFPTPDLVIKITTYLSGTTAAPAAAAPMGGARGGFRGGQAPQQGGGYNWGRGNVLGAD